MQPGSTFGQQRGGQGALCVTFGTWGNANASNPPRGNGLIHIRIITVFFGAAVRSLVRCGTCQKVVVSLSIFRIRNDSRELYDANRCSKMVVCLFFRDALPESVASPQSFPDFVSDFPGLPGGALAAGGKRFRIPVRVRTVVGRSRADSARPIRRALPDRRRVRSISPRTDSLRLRSRVVPCGVCRASDCAAVRNAVPDRPCAPSGRQPAPRPNPP